MQALKGKKAIVTGAGRGVGKAISFALAREGVKLGLIARTEENVMQVAKEIELSGGTVHHAVGDVSDYPAIREVVENLVQSLKGVDILINNAAVASMGSTLEMPVAEWERIIHVNVLGTYYVTRTVLPFLIKNNSGDIVTIASSAGLRANANAGAYSASKFAVTGFMEALMNEVRQYNIRVSTLMPSTIATDMAEGLGIIKDAERIMQPDDLADFVVHQLKLEPRVFVKSASLWGTNP